MWKIWHINTKITTNIFFYIFYILFTLPQKQNITSKSTLWWQICDMLYMYGTHTHLLPWAFDIQWLMSVLCTVLGIDGDELFVTQFTYLLYLLCKLFEYLWLILFSYRHREIYLFDMTNIKWTLNLMSRICNFKNMLM